MAPTDRNALRLGAWELLFTDTPPRVVVDEAIELFKNEEVEAISICFMNAFANPEQEQAAAERSELSIVQEFLPSLADEETTRAWVKEAVEAVGASSPKDIGSVMGKLMGSHKGEVDGALANRILRQVLAE